jgi:hypothetical protein
MYDQDDDEPLTTDHENPDESDMTDEPATFPCPYCKRELTEDAERCHYCGAYLSQEDAPKPISWTWLVAVILLIAILLTWLWKM